MTQRRRSSLLERTHRLVFLYLFRDYDRGTLDAGLEYTNLSPVGEGRVLCRASTFNLKGLKRDRFLVEISTRRIVNLPGRYICYWVDEWKASVRIYDRKYRKSGERTYSHDSTDARSKLAFDNDGLEKRAENLVRQPRRYHEKFTRLFRF